MLIIEIEEGGVSTMGKPKDDVKGDTGNGGCVMIACCVECSNDD